MGHAVLPGNPPIEITLRRSARARRISLRVSALDGRVTLSMPNGTDAAQALDFAKGKSEWIRAHLARQKSVEVVRFGMALPVLGRMRTLVAGPVKRPRLEPDALILPDAPKGTARRVQGFLKHQAAALLREASDKYAGMLDRSYHRLTLRDTRSRWGSCTAQGNLMYSWRLVMAPAEVLDYVAAHEVAHLAELNHGPQFWDIVERFCPDYSTHRSWLRENGQDLHRYRFDD